MLDGFSGYNQISMVVKDHLKTYFYYRMETICLLSNTFWFEKYTNYISKSNYACLCRVSK